MSKYTIQITGMHCSGCKTLIAMSLEDVGFEEIRVDEKTGSAEFVSSRDTVNVNTALTELFNELKDYRFSNLEIINI
jgi:copper chaperone CopZ